MALSVYYCTNIPIGDSYVYWDFTPWRLVNAYPKHGSSKRRIGVIVCETILLPVTANFLKETAQAVNQ